MEISQTSTIKLNQKAFGSVAARKKAIQILRKERIELESKHDRIFKIWSKVDRALATVNENAVPSGLMSVGVICDNRGQSVITNTPPTTPGVGDRTTPARGLSIGLNSNYDRRSETPGSAATYRSVGTASKFGSYLMAKVGRPLIHAKEVATKKIVSHYHELKPVSS